MRVAGFVVAGLLAADVVAAQAPVRSERFEGVAPVGVAETGVGGGAALVSERSGVWKTAAAGAGAGAVVSGAAAYALYPNLRDPWLSRGQHTALSALQGAVVGGGIGLLVVWLTRSPPLAEERP